MVYHRYRIEEGELVTYSSDKKFSLVAGFPTPEEAWQNAATLYDKKADWRQNELAQLQKDVAYMQTDINYNRRKANEARAEAIRLLQEAGK